MTRYILHVDVPFSADVGTFENEVLRAAITRTGMTIVTPDRIHFDVDVVSVQRDDHLSTRPHDILPAPQVDLK